MDATTALASNLLLACGYFLNGGMGAFMQPSASAGSSPPPSYVVIATQGGAQLVTQGGALIITNP